MNRTKSLCFPVKGFSELSLTFSEAFGVVVAMVSGIVSSLLVLVLFVSRFRLSVSRYQMLSKYRGVKISVSVLRCQISSSQSFEVLVGQDFVVSGCRGAL
jgi:hypothetical protein